MDDVIKEVLRMYGPAGSIFPRVVVKDHYIGNIPIKKGTLVGVLIKPNQFKD
jgi:cytochrome P450